MSEPVDTSAEAVELAIKDQWAAAVTGWQMTVCDRTAAILRALAADRDAARRTSEYWKAEHLAANDHIAELESLLATRNQQNAAAFTECDRLRKLATFGERCRLPQGEGTASARQLGRVQREAERHS